MTNDKIARFFNNTRAFMQGNPDPLRHDLDQDLVVLKERPLKGGA
jgi:hypothetical protein